MKSLFKKISLLTFLLVAVFSFCLTVSAQEISTSTKSGSYATPEQLEAINSIPEVYVSQLVINREDFRPGETVTGSFILTSSKNIKTPNIFYNIYLAGGYGEDGLNKYEYGIQKSNLFFLSPNEKKEIKFSYRLPVAAEGYGVDGAVKLKVRAYTDNGWPLGWQDIAISVNSVNLLSTVNIISPIVKVGQKSYALEAGPTVHSGEKALLNLKVSNPAGKEVKLIPKFSIYTKDINGTPLKSYFEKEVTIKSKESQTLSYTLPDFDFTPSVYVGELSFVDANNISRSTVIKFRYIIGGDIVNIHNITTDKQVVNKGDIINLKMLFTGTPFDIATAAQNTATSSAVDFDLKVYSEKDILVASYAEKAEVNKLKSLIVVTAQNSAKALRVEAAISKDGKILDDYKSDLGAEYDIAKNNLGKNKITIYVGIIIIALIVLFLMMKIIKKNRKVPLMVLILLAFCLPIFKTEAFTATNVWHEWDWNSYYGGTQLAISSPQPGDVRTYAPGEVFNLDGTAYIASCINGPSRVYVFARLESGSTRTAYDSGGIGLSTCGNGTDYCGSSRDFSYSSFTAPSTPGTYRIYLVVESYYTPSGKQTSSLSGYQDFVVAVPPPVNGVCGISNGTVTNTKPTANLCLAGAVTTVSGTGPWTWSCNGSNGGTSASCRASLPAVNGACGSATSTPRLTAPTANLCSGGNPTAVSGTGPWTWSCSGSNGGLTTTCSVPVLNAPTNLTTTCNASGTAVTVSWSPVTGTSGYWPRISYQNKSLITCNSGFYKWEYLCGKDNISATSFTYTTDPDKAYSTWVHTGLGGVPNNTMEVRKDFTCAGPIVVATTTPLSVTCKANSASFVATSTVTWSATPTGGTAPYTYSWIFNGSPSTDTLASVDKTYFTAGNYYATTTVKDNSLPQKSVVVPCSTNGTTIDDNGNCTGCNSHGINISSPVPPPLPVPPNPPLPPAVITADSLVCDLVKMDNPTASPVNINVNTTWTLYRSVSTSTATAVWRIEDANGTSYATSTPNGTNVLNKTFTTVGLKNVYGHFDDGVNSPGLECHATTSVVQEGGNNRER